MKTQYLLHCPAQPCTATKTGIFTHAPARRNSGGLARWSVGLRGRSALRARHVAGGRALDLGWRNPVAAMWAGRGERCSHLFKVDLLAGGHSGDSTA
jgi:hypothetical protein